MEVGSSRDDGGGCVLVGHSWRWDHLRVVVEDAHGGGIISGGGGDCVLGGHTWRWHHLRMMLEAVSLEDGHGGSIISG